MERLQRQQPPSPASFEGLQDIPHPLSAHPKHLENLSLTGQHNFGFLAHLITQHATVPLKLMRITQRHFQGNPKQARPLCTWTANLSVAKPQQKHSVCPSGCPAPLTHRSFQALFCCSHLEFAAHSTSPAARVYAPDLE